MARPRKVYDPFTGAPDHHRSVPGRHPRGEWVSGIYVLADKNFIDTDDFRSATGFSERRLLRPNRVCIRGERLA